MLLSWDRGGGGGPIMRIPRLLIAGTHSGVGKTTVTLGLIQGLKSLGLSVQPFKLGPDFIDPGFHSQVAGRPSRNLDSWLVPSHELVSLFRRACEGTDVALIEGVMGLYDGIGATGEEASTAQLSKFLGCPVLLVVDASALSRSGAAIVKGFAELDRKVRVVGCFLNRVASPGHYALVKQGIEKLTGIPVVGYLPRDERLQLPERHLGLVPSNERRGWQKILGPLAVRIRQGVDLEAVVRLSRRTESLEGDGKSSGPKVSPQGSRSRIPIGVAMDEVFHFYYPENMEFLASCGAEVVPFSPLADSRLPRGIAALYLGGGFPEVYASALTRNHRLHREIREKVVAGLPVYAECGGLMYLARGIHTTLGRRYPMVGLLPGEIQMTDRLQHFGYKEVRARRPSLLAYPGERARGHEFHHSVPKGIPRAESAAYTAGSPAGGASRLEGFAKHSLLASYIHIHFLNCPHWGQRFVQAARDWQANQKGK